MVALDLNIKYTELYNDVKLKRIKKKHKLRVWRRKERTIKFRMDKTHMGRKTWKRSKFVQTHLQQTGKAIKQTVCSWTFFSSTRKQAINHKVQLRKIFMSILNLKEWKDSYRACPHNEELWWKHCTVMVSGININVFWYTMVGIMVLCAF